MVPALAAVVTQCNHAELIGRIPWRRRGPARPGRRIRDDSLLASLAAARWLPGISADCMAAWFSGASMSVRCLRPTVALPTLTTLRACTACFAAHPLVSIVSWLSHAASAADAMHPVAMAVDINAAEYDLPRHIASHAACSASTC